MQAKISGAKKRKDELLKFDDTSMAKELDFGPEFVEKARTLEAELITLWSKRSLCEKRMELHKAKYLHMKAHLPF